MSLKSLKQKLENFTGEYTFNYANEDDCEYFLENFGGEEQLKKDYPAIYESFIHTKESALRDTYSKESASVICDVTLGTLHLQRESGNTKQMSMAAGEDGHYCLTASLHCTFVDYTKNVYTDELATEWKGVTVQTTIKDKYSNKVIYKGSKIVHSGNHYNGSIKSRPEKLSMINNKSYVTTVDLTAKDSNGKIYSKHVVKEQQIGEDEIYPIFNVTVNDPAPRRTTKHPDQIIMLYGRMNEQAIYSEADYKGGDFLYNAFNYDLRKVHLLIPITGEVILDYNVKPLGLFYSEQEAFIRSTATYEYKQQEFTFREDIRNDRELYNKLRNNFKAEPYSPSLRTKVAFNFDINDDNTRSRYDWRCDIEGVPNGDPKTIMFQGAFDYAYNDQLDKDADSQIIIKSVTKDELKELGKNYYQYDRENYIVYIPPITIYWGCFGKDVKITLADQSQKNASDIKIGDKVIGYDDQILTVNDVVTGRDQTIFCIKTKNNGEIKVSGGHPMMCEGECVRAARLKIGDKLNLADGSLGEIESIEVVHYDDTVYNFTFDDCENGTYLIANGFYSGDLKMQNKKPKIMKQVLTEKDHAFIAEMSRYSETMEAGN